jgi:hypothetical protein
LINFHNNINIKSKLSKNKNYISKINVNKYNHQTLKFKHKKIILSNYIKNKLSLLKNNNNYNIQNKSILNQNKSTI